MAFGVRRRKLFRGFPGPPPAAPRPSSRLSPFNLFRKPCALPAGKAVGSRLSGESCVPTAGPLAFILLLRVGTPRARLFSPAKTRSDPFPPADRPDPLRLPLLSCRPTPDVTTSLQRKNDQLHPEPSGGPQNPQLHAPCLGPEKERLLAV